MGHHYLPQYYLHGFTQLRKSELWMYEKKNGPPRFLPIVKIAQETRLYGSIESELATQVEDPANAVLAKIRNEMVISDADKMILSKYIFILLKRVPAAFNRFQGNASKIAKDTLDDIEKYLHYNEKNNPEKASNYDSIRKEAKRIMKGLVDDPSKEVWAKSIQYSNGLPQELLSQMTWTFYLCQDPEIFITGDNPVFIHKSIGMKRAYSDLSFPISKRISLLASWQRLKDRQYVKANPCHVKELNRRTTYNAMRFVFSPTDKPWIMQTLSKGNPQIHLWASLSTNPIYRF